MRIAVVVVVALGAIAAAGPPAKTPALLATGKAIYEGSAAGCWACHGYTGEGNGPVAFALKPPPRNFRKDPFKGGDTVANVFATITNGLAGTQMVSYARLPEADRWALAHYVLGFRTK
ncbi:MAG: cytochrome c [Kofleriaceae bacterium]